MISRTSLRRLVVITAVAAVAVVGVVGSASATDGKGHGKEHSQDKDHHGEHPAPAEPMDPPAPAPTLPVIGDLTCGLLGLLCPPTPEPTPTYTLTVTVTRSEGDPFPAAGSVELGAGGPVCTINGTEPNTCTVTSAGPSTVTLTAAPVGDTLFLEYDAPECPDGSFNQRDNDLTCDITVDRDRTVQAFFDAELS